jgi:hypothetical protein
MSSTNILYPLEPAQTIYGHSHARSATEGRLIDRFIEHTEALADGQETYARELQAAVDDLLREKEEIEKWVAVGSA